LTITGTLLSTFLITLGLLLGIFAWSGYFGPPLAAGAPQATTLGGGDAHILVSAARARTRFVASEVASTRAVPVAERPTQVSLKAAHKKQPAARERRAQAAPVVRPQAANSPWPWASWFK
jgi:hypothetical protein